MSRNHAQLNELMQSSDFHKHETEHTLRSPLDEGVSVFAWFLVGVLLMSAVVLAIV